MEPGTGLFFHSNLLHRSDAKPQPQPALVADRLLQHEAQRPVQDRRRADIRITHRWKKLPDEQVKQVARRGVGCDAENTHRPQAET